MSVITRAQGKSDANTYIPDNVNKEVSPEDTRQRIIDLWDSAVSKKGDSGIQGKLSYSADFVFSDDKDIPSVKFVNDAIDGISGYIKADGSVDFTGNQSMGGNSLIEVLAISGPSGTTAINVDSRFLNTLTGQIIARFDDLTSGFGVSTSSYFGYFKTDDLAADATLQIKRGGGIVVDDFGAETGEVIITKNVNSGIESGLVFNELFGNTVGLYTKPNTVDPDYMFGFFVNDETFKVGYSLQGMIEGSAAAGSEFISVDSVNVEIGTVIAENVNIGTATSNEEINIGTNGTSNVINIGSTTSTINLRGTAVYEYETNAYISDRLITLNEGGGAATGSGTGFEIEENNVITGYFKTTGGRDGFLFKAPSWSNDISISGTFTGNRAFLFPDHDGTVITTGDTGTVSNAMLAGSISPGKVTVSNTQIIVGNGSNVGASVALSLNATAGSFSLANTGVLTFPDANETTRGLVTAADHIAMSSGRLWAKLTASPPVATGGTSNVEYVAYSMAIPAFMQPYDVCDLTLQLAVTGGATNGKTIRVYFGDSSQTVGNTFSATGTQQLSAYNINTASLAGTHSSRFKFGSNIDTNYTFGPVNSSRINFNNYPTTGKVDMNFNFSGGTRYLIITVALAVTTDSMIINDIQGTYFR